MSLAWNPSTNIPNAAGYALYYGSTSGNYSSRIDIGTNTSAIIPGLNEGHTNYFMVKAYNTAKVESVASGEIAYIVPGLLVMAWLQPGNIASLSFPVAWGHWYSVQASVDLKTWATIWQTATATSNAWVQFQDPQTSMFKRRFYR
ncbi:MAG TPA: fibronectin type III domain-containing protein, partial [Verrucomicrobiae bacterium]|nr:fibronectin type III domain-containing protein [Verrucomicrobiae bacterium]